MNPKLNLTFLILLQIEFFIKFSKGQRNNFQIPDITKCGQDLGCVRVTSFNQTNGCLIDNCPYTFIYKLLPSQANFYLSSSEGEYVAVGFADDKTLSEMEIYACFLIDGEVKVKLYHLSEETGDELNEIWYKEGAHIKIFSTNSTHGVRCHFNRLTIPWNIRNRDLNADYFLVYLWGKVKNELPILKNTTSRQFDWYSSIPDRINLKKPRNEIKQVQIDLTPNNTMCNFSINCVRISENSDTECEETDCVYKLSFLKISGNKFPLYLYSAKAEYVAVGLTEDNDTLTDTEIIGCKKDKNNTISSFYYWISNRHQLKSPQVQNKGLKFIKGEATSQGLWCSLIKIVREDGTVNDSDKSQIYLWGKLSENGDPILPDSTKMMKSKKVITIDSKSINLLLNYNSSSIKQFFSYTILIFFTIIFEKITKKLLVF